MQIKHPAVFKSPAHAWFLANLPEIKSRTRACFAYLRYHEREEAIAEVTAAVFKASVHAAHRGVLHRVTAYHAVVFAVKHFRQGRRMAGYTSTDVLSEATRIKGRTTIIQLSAVARLRDGRRRTRALTVAETLADSRQDNAPFEQARQNLDYAVILKSDDVSRKARRVFRFLAAIRGRGHVNEIAHRLNVSAGRVCQLKDQLAEALARHDYAPAGYTH